MNLKCLVLTYIGTTIISHAVVEWIHRWNSSGPETGGLISTAVDRHGREHVVYTEESQDSIGLYHSLRTSPAALSWQNSLLVSYPLSDPPRALSVDVNEGLETLIGLVQSNGEVRAMHWDGSNLLNKLIATNGCSSMAYAGIDVSASKRGLDSSILFTRGLQGSLDQPAGLIHATLQNGSWVDKELSSDQGHGIGPTLIHTPDGMNADSSVRRVVACYDEAEEEVQWTRQNALEFWSPFTIVANSVEFTRPCLATHSGRVGITYRDSSQVIYALFSVTPGKDGSLFSGYSWQSSVVASASELDLPGSEFHSPRCPLVLDPEGNPIVAFYRGVAPALLSITEKILVRRHLPGIGWEHLKDRWYPSPDTPGFHAIQANGMDLAMNVNGDPFLVYEEDAGTTSRAIYSYPVNPPWVARPSPSNPIYSKTLSPALATGPDGTLHLAYSRASGGDIFGSPVEFHRSAVISYYPDNTATRTTFLGINKPHLAQDLTVTPDGIVHWVQLRENTSTTGDLLYATLGPADIFANDHGAIGNLNEAGLDMIDLEHDQDGNLYLSALSFAGKTYLWKKEQGGSWNTIATVPDPISKTSLAVRKDGAWALAFLRASQLVLWTTIYLTNGGTLSSPTEHIMPLDSSPLP